MSLYTLYKLGPGEVPQPIQLLDDRYIVPVHIRTKSSFVEGQMNAYVYVHENWCTVAEQMFDQYDSVAEDLYALSDLAATECPGIHIRTVANSWPNFEWPEPGNTGLSPDQYLWWYLGRTQARSFYLNGNPNQGRGLGRNLMLSGGKTPLLLFSTQENESKLQALEHEITHDIQDAFWAGYEAVSKYQHSLEIQYSLDLTKARQRYEKKRKQGRLVW